MARRLLVKITFSREHAKQQLPINKMMSHLLTSSTPFIEEIELMPMPWRRCHSQSGRPLLTVIIPFLFISWNKTPMKVDDISHKDTRVRRINSKLVSYPNISPQVWRGCWWCTPGRSPAWCGAGGQAVLRLVLWLQEAGVRQVPPPAGQHCQAQPATMTAGSWRSRHLCSQPLTGRTWWRETTRGSGPWSWSHPAARFNLIIG